MVKLCIITNGASGSRGVSRADDSSRSISRPRPAQTYTPPEAGRPLREGLPRPRVQGIRRPAVGEQPRLVQVRRPPAARHQWIPEPLHVPRAAGQGLLFLKQRHLQMFGEAFWCVAQFVSSCCGGSPQTVRAMIVPALMIHGCMCGHTVPVRLGTTAHIPIEIVP